MTAVSENQQSKKTEKPSENREIIDKNDIL
jgi:hypothetical protein